MILGVCPVGELVVAEFKVLFVGGVVFTYESVVVNESLEACRKLFDVLIDFVKAGDVLAELEFVATDGAGGRSDDSENERLHHQVV